MPAKQSANARRVQRYREKVRARDIPIVLLKRVNRERKLEEAKLSLSISETAMLHRLLEEAVRNREATRAVAG